MSQTVVNTYSDVAIKGQPADARDKNNDILTYNNPDEQIVYGRGVVKVPSDDDGVKLPDAVDNDFLGIAVRNMNSEFEYYEAKSAVPVGRRGRYYVEVEEAVTPGDDVYCRYAGKAQVQTITFDADLILNNNVDMDVDGVAMTTVPWNASHDQTMQDICTQLTTDFSQIATATCPGGGSRVITVTAASNGVDIAITNVLVSGGASQANATVAETVDAVSDDDRGKFRTDVDSTTARQVTEARWMSAADAGGLAILDLWLT